MILLFKIHLYTTRFIHKFKINIHITYIVDFKSPLTSSAASFAKHGIYHNL